MSRVQKPNKYVNTVKYDNSITSPSKKMRIHFDTEDYHKAATLTSWLFMKYDMSYKTYTRKSKKRKDELRAEYIADTGNESPQDRIIRKCKEAHECDDMSEEEVYDLLASIGVPFLPDGTPLGIGDD